MHQAVNYLSEELYSKDAHFLMELLQNAEDNKYGEGVTPSLEFVVTSKDITATGAKSTLLLFNNEIGFSPANIDSICRIGKSTKKGNRHHGYIGEKGIGFKSVFLISSKPYIFSNGYQIRFDEEPSPECGLGYIVPEWVEENPSLSDIQNIYRPSKSLPTTVIILPLKGEKESAVKQQLSNLHPEMLLFLHKVRQLSVREFDAPKSNTVSEISISSEINYQARKNMNAESYTLHLAAHEGGEGEEEECGYYMWKQKFPVKKESAVKKRMEVDEWLITLAFPFGRRLNRGLKESGVYSFLPTEMVTGFPFIIQADFLLVSSRESILLNNPWNEGILNCGPSAFANAFLTLVQGSAAAPSSSVPFLFKFIPVKVSSIQLLDSVRITIKEKLVAERIIPCECNSSQKIFCKPDEISRLNSSFWSVLNNAQKDGVDIRSLHSHGRYIVNSYFDCKEYDQVLSFLGVDYVDKSWYRKFIESSNLARKVAEEVYLDLLYFISCNWSSCLNDLPLLKFIDNSGGISLFSLTEATDSYRRLCIADADSNASWLVDWNQEFMNTSNRFFMPQSTQKYLRVYRAELRDWLLKIVNLQILSVHAYGSIVVKSLKSCRHVIAFTHFLYHSRKFTTDWCINDLCSSLPIVDDYGHVIFARKQVLVPAKVSKWAGLLGSNPWRGENYIVLSTEYLSSGKFAGNYTSEGQILKFLQQHVNASDIPNIIPPNTALTVVNSPLTKDNAFLLLEWIRYIRCQGNTNNLQNFLSSIRNGSWLKTCIGFKPSSESFLPSSGWGNLFQVASVLVDIPLIDQEFYGKKILNYTEELRFIGVRFDFSQASIYIGEHLKTAAANSTLTRENVYSLLKLIRYLGEKLLSPSFLIQTIKGGRWLKTSFDFKFPSECVLLEPEWLVASEVSNVPFIDVTFYGRDIFKYKTELNLLGVLIGLKKNYQVVVDNLKMPLSSTSADATILILECIGNAKVPDNLIRNLKQMKWLRTTHLGHRTPCESFLAVLGWECLLQVVSDIPLIDEKFYGNRIRSYEAELKKVGVGVSISDLSKTISNKLNHLASTSSMTSKNIIALLSCLRHFTEWKHALPKDLMDFTHESKWLHTQLGFRSPKDSVLFSSEWQSISVIATLPLIGGNSSFYGYSNKIYEYKNELKDLGVVVEFNEGAKFVSDGINIPYKNPSVITPASVLYLLKCIHNLKEKVADLPQEFMRSVNKRWLKTDLGYKSPSDSILFDSEWGLQRGDGPFIDDTFYGSEIVSYRNELNAIGAIVEGSDGCSLLADYMKYHSDVTTISRIYMYLNKFKWEPEDVEENWIWIPSGGGQWVSSTVCILHDEHNMFGSQLIILDKWYDTRLIRFFSIVLKVRSSPNIKDFCELWRSWEALNYQLTTRHCSAFWLFVTMHRNANTALLQKCVSKIPVLKNKAIVLCNKHDVFIPDDLLLKDLFNKHSDEAIFVWYPHTKSSVSRAQLNETYRIIGVRTISEVVEKDEPFTSSGSNMKEVYPSSIMLKNGLFRIVLAFLCHNFLDMKFDVRHGFVKKLHDSKIFEVDEPITVSYKLSLSTGKNLVAVANTMVCWETDEAKLFMQVRRAKTKHGSIQFATNFADAIVQGLLFETPDQIASLAELIKLGFLLDFDEDAVDFLLKTKNLDVFPEDEELLSALTSSEKSSKVEAEEPFVSEDRCSAESGSAA